MIINPMWFYWMNVFDKLQFVSFVISMLTGITGVIALGCYCDDHDNDALRDSKRLLLVALCFGLVALFTPSEKTMTKMLIASQVNETNVERAKEVVDYIVDKVKEVREDQK